jgi:hypothetical protein
MYGIWQGRAEPVQLENRGGLGGGGTCPASALSACRLRRTKASKLRLGGGINYG